MTALDKALIVRAQLGSDDQAFGRLVAIYQGSVRGFLRRLTAGDEALADDLAQDTFLTAYKQMPKFRGDGSFQGWLMRIAYTSFLQHRRRPMNREIASDDKQLLQREEADTPPLHARLDVEQAMTQLSENERACITLCYTYGMSHGEASETLDIPLGTVKSHILRGKEKLKQSLSSWQGEVIS
ncbi:MAG: sigma-70 family RNA polymerase sigma factor [Sphingomonadales bacterium]|jgi:RNA polymerase sigma-70 factor (ECF subfamily)